MNNILTPLEEVFWLHKHEYIPHKLVGTHSTDVVIVGGGMAGISAAQSFHEKGLKVILLEHYHCGTGATGKSSGFVTANAELGLTHFMDVYGAHEAHRIWNFVNDGVSFIRNNIKKYNLDCDYVPEDVLIAATSHHGFKELKKEHDNYQKLHFQSSLFQKDELSAYVSSRHFYGGMAFTSNFGVNPYAYVQGMKKVLLDQGVSIFEETPVLKLNAQSVETADAIVNAQHIIVCADRFIPDLGKLEHELYQVQTFVLISNPLTEDMIKTIFPQKRFMIWDTELVYNYYRITGDNRFMIGGSTLWESFRSQPTYHAQSVYNKLLHYVKKHFPQLTFHVEYMWPGMIGISKDLKPIIGPDKDTPSIYYVGAATGLAWAATLGNYAAEHIVNARNDFDAIFSPYRSFPLPNIVQTIFGKKITFSLSNLIAMKS